MTHDQIQSHYPRLNRPMQWAACLTTGEAISAIQCHKRGSKWAGEAVNHFGGNKTVFASAWNCRHSFDRF